jgi:hypothetical protein
MQQEGRREWMYQVVPTRAASVALDSARLAFSSAIMTAALRRRVVELAVFRGGDAIGAGDTPSPVRVGAQLAHC